MRVFGCMATSLDGKIGPANVDQFVALGSRYDMEQLISLRDEADGILFGAGTFRAWPKVHRGHDATRKTPHFILSHSLDIDFNAELFSDPKVPVTVFNGSNQRYDATVLPEQVEVILIPDQANQIDSILKHIEGRGVTSLLIEGGGQILNQFFKAQAIQELFLTLVPSIIGDRDAPTLLGNKNLSPTPKIEILSRRLVKDEVYFHLKFDYSSFSKTRHKK